ncbi:acylaminoacyl-peptidase [Ephemerocybe angulata]|uniref:acylaminoacyl-peptidase n=1 Tax=Ephemerocybe angulata TaxID=980116 RepID=A0A8H6HJP3_9AGAR|nr:acylaminoacyl-peptidase [Tulosesus angulatus]
MYTKLAEIPVPTGAQFLAQELASIQLSFSVRDHERNVKKSLVKQIVLSNSGPATVLPAQEVNYVAARYSLSGRNRVVLREAKEGSGTKYFVELWRGDSLRFTLDVTEKHGAFYADEFIGSLSFSHDEMSVVYTAEAQVEKKDDGPYAKFRFKADLGEGLSGKRRPTAFIVHWDKDDVPSVSRIETPEQLYLGQYIFCQNPENRLYAAAYELQSDWRLLGVKGCFNRPRGIWQVDLVKEAYPEVWKCTLTKLTDSHLSCRSPRIVDDKLVWLSEAAGGPHISTSTVQSLPIGPEASSGEATTLLDVVEQPKEDGFPGLYAPANFPASPTLCLDPRSNYPTHLAVHSTIGSRTGVVLVSLKGGYSVADLGDSYSWNVLATDGESRIVCSRSTPAIPYEIVVGEVANDTSITWTVVDRPTLSQDVAAALSSIKTQIIKVPDREPTETIVIQSPSNGEHPPTVLVPHGGPHGTTTTAFNAATTALVLEGFTLSHPNYTGSPGFGDAAIRGLVGQCGRRDVDDCIGSLDHIVKLGIAQVGPGKLFVMGGSHGGFLAAHLIGQFPDRFTAASMRNPVISGGDTSTTDIPDWYYSEFGLSYPVESSPKGTMLSSDGSHIQYSASSAAPTSSGPVLPPLMTSEHFKKLQLDSPISYVDHVKAPVLLLIGLDDRRVSPAQGIEYYHALKARASDKSSVDMLVFEGESHPLEGVEAARVCYEAARDWFKAKAQF